MIWADIAAGFDRTANGAQGVYFGKHKNPNLMNAMIANNGLAALPELRSDALLFGGGVTGVRFIRARTYTGTVGDAGYLCFVVVNGGAAVVARSDKLAEFTQYQFFATETACITFVESLKKRGALAVGSRVAIETLNNEAAIGAGQPLKVQAYAKLRAATTDKYYANRAFLQAGISIGLSGANFETLAAQAHAVAWLDDARARHAAAAAGYVALGGLIEGGV